MCSGIGPFLKVRVRVMPATPPIRTEPTATNQQGRLAHAHMIGQVEAIFRYPVKSMAGERLEVATLGWHGLDGDRRLALRRVGVRSGMPWLTAGRLHDLVLYVPQRHDEAAEADLPNACSHSGWRRIACLRGGVGLRSDVATVPLWR